MAYWLLKSDPDTYGFDDLERDRRTTWDGVANALALSHMRRVEKGDECLIYHTGTEKAIVGLARVTRGAYADPKVGDTKIVAFDLQAGDRLEKPVTLAALKADARFADFALVRLGRLSVMPVPPPLWKRILEMAG